MDFSTTSQLTDVPSFNQSAHVHENPYRNDCNFVEEKLNLTTAKTLLILDRGFDDFLFFANLIAQQVDFITRLKSNASIEVVKVLTSNYRRNE